MFIQKRGHETKTYEHSQLSSRLDFLINVNMMSNCSCSAHKHILSYFYPQPFIYVRQGSASVAHYHLMRHAAKRVAVNRAVYEEVKGCCFTQPLRNFIQSMLQTLHKDPKESHQLVENGKLK